MKSSSFKDHCLGYANGSTVLHLSKKAIPEYDFLIPTKDIVEKYNVISNMIIEKIAINQQEIFSLSSQRDTLLPRLMSGEVKIKE